MKFSRSRQHLEIMCNFTRDEVILAYRGCDALHSGVDSQVQNKGFQLTLPFTLGTTSLGLGENVKIVRRYIDRSKQLIFWVDTSLER